jgi:hypothetical protein
MMWHTATSALLRTSATGWLFASALCMTCTSWSFRLSSEVTTSTAEKAWRVLL